MSSIGSRPSDQGAQPSADVDRTNGDSDSDEKHSISNGTPRPEVPAREVVRSESSLSANLDEMEKSMSTSHLSSSASSSEKSSKSTTVRRSSILRSDGRLSRTRSGMVWGSSKSCADSSSGRVGPLGKRLRKAVSWDDLDPFGEEELDSRGSESNSYLSQTGAAASSGDVILSRSTLQENAKLAATFEQDGSLIAASEACLNFSTGAVLCDFQASNGSVSSYSAAGTTASSSSCPPTPPPSPYPSKTQRVDNETEASWEDSATDDESAPSIPSSADTEVHGNYDPHKKRKSISLVQGRSDYSDWSVGERYELTRFLGRGSYGEVAQAVNKRRDDEGYRELHGPTFYAIKKISGAFESEIEAVRLFREIHILRRLRGHDCIIKLLDVIIPPTYEGFRDLYLVFEYVDTDLYKLIMSPQYLSIEHIQTFLYQLLAGLNYIHSFSVIHRDLKPANILLNEDCSLKICDFGLARIVHTSHHDDFSLIKQAISSDSLAKTSKIEDEVPADLLAPPPTRLTRQLTKHVVTRWYRAPELILIESYTSAVDIWSLGCIFAELLSMQEGSVPKYQDRMPLFPGGSCYPLSGDVASMKKDERLDQLNVIFSVIGTPEDEEICSIGQAKKYLKSLTKRPGREFQSIYPAATSEAIDLLKRMLQFNPRKRCTAREALEHDFFRHFRRREMEITADRPLCCPAFLEQKEIDIETLRRHTYEEVLWFDNQVPIRRDRMN